MKVFKFGGASLKNADTIRKTVSIIAAHRHENLLVVLSAMHHTTDALEKIIALSQAGKNYDKELGDLEAFHAGIVNDLFADKHGIMAELSSLIKELTVAVEQKGDYDFVYDQAIGYGEIISSVIVCHFLLQEGVQALWIDARKYISTDSTFREGQVQWADTESRLRDLAPSFKTNTVITQGFIGSNKKKETVSLGREGSDFSAAIFGYCLRAESVTVWKGMFPA